MENYVEDDTDATPVMSVVATDTPGKPDSEKEVSDSVKAQVAKILGEIRADIKHHAKAIKRMRRDMFVAMHGHEESWSEASYKANITGRHVKQKTASLYAKNPKVVAYRRETLDFKLWDESEQSLTLAFQTVQAATQAAAQAAATPIQVDPHTGVPIVPPPPEMPPGFQEAQALIADFQQGMQHRQTIKKFGRTLEILFQHAMRAQKPLDFKQGMKQLVRRAITTCVGYVELGFQRETGPRPGSTERLTDFRARLDHLKNLAQKAAEGEIDDTAAEMAELEASIAALQSEPEVVLRSGLTFDFLQSTKVIPDRATKSLVGFVGADHLTIMYLYSKDKVQEVFGVDIGEQYTPYTKDGRRGDGVSRADFNDQDQGELFDGNNTQSKKAGDLVCVYKYYDQPSGLVYYIADGYCSYLRDPAPPEVFVTDFWPVYALTFNAVESEDELFPESDVTALLDMQREHNRSRQGKREHREAARPRWAYANGTLDDKDVELLQKSKPFDAIGLNVDADRKLMDVLQSIPVPGVDNNLYDTNENMTDMTLVVGAQGAQMGATTGDTATESAIAASSSATGDGSNIDDLDAFFSSIARAGGQILMRELSEEEVVKAVGVGAVWIPQSLTEISDEVYLEVEAGSTGKPNQAVEINNWTKMLPFLMQMGSIPSTWLARESLRRMDDRMDLTEAVVDGLPSLMAQSAAAQQQVTQSDPTKAPSQQGAKGAANTPTAPGGPAGTDAPMGDNHTTPGVVAHA